MKHLLFAMTLISSPLFAFSTSENYQIKINWLDPATLQDSVVQICDDTSYPAIEIIIPGRAGVDFAVDMDADITNGKVSLGCDVKKTDGRGFVKYTFDAISSCTVKVYQLRTQPGQKRKTATYELHDAC